MTGIKRVTMGRPRVVMCSFVVMALLAGCGTSGTDESAANDGAQETSNETDDSAADDGAQETGDETDDSAEITHSIQMPGVISYELNLPTLVADASGSLAEHGIEITDYVTGSGGTLRQAVIAGEYGVGLFGTVHPVLARVNGSPWKIVFSAHDREIFSLIVRSEIADEVTTVEDLAGRRVGFSKPGASSWYVGRAILQQAGLDPDTDLEYVSLGGDPGVIYSALKEGDVDAFSSWEPTTTRTITEGVAEALVPMWEDEVHQEYIGSSTLSMAVIATEDQINEDPEFVQALVDAHMEAMEFIADAEPAEIAELVMNHENTAALFEGLSEELVIEMLEKIHGGFGTGCLDRAGYETNMDMLLEHEVVEERVEFEEIAATQFAGEC